MIVELINTGQDVALNKWHRVFALNGVCHSMLYVRFVFAWDNNGRLIDKLPAGETITVDMRYNGTEYP